MLSRKYAAAIPTEILVPLDCFINTFLTWCRYCTELRFLCGIHGIKARHSHSQSKHLRNCATLVLIKRFVCCSLTHHPLTYHLTHSLTHTHTIAHSLSHELSALRNVSKLNFNPFTPSALTSCTDCYRRCCKWPPSTPHLAWHRITCYYKLFLIYSLQISDTTCLMISLTLL